MAEHNFIFSIFLIFSGAALLSTLALYTRQSMLVAYILLGLLLGPFGMKLINNTKIVQTISDVGIIFLLFLLGLNLPPQKLFLMLRKTVWVGVISTAIFGAVGYWVAWFSGYTMLESFVVGAAMVFSSTIIGIKLLPTTILHQQHMGEVMISVLLLQDLFAIIVLLVMHGVAAQALGLREILLVLLGFPILLVFVYSVERFVLRILLARFSRVKEYMFLVAIGWCLGVAQLSASFGLSGEIGAFIAGVSLAASPVAVYIAESLKPIRDFFLVIFFFSVGANFNLNYFP